MKSVRRSTRGSSTAHEAVQKSATVVTAALEADKPRSKRAKRSQPTATKEIATTASKSGGGGAPQGISRYYEKQQWDKGFKAVAGVDEAGRGPLAGPVVAAACIVPPSVDIKGGLEKINDSKQLTEEEREELYELITSNPDIIWAVKAVDVETIDKINILEATMQAMELSVSGLKVAADFVLVDGNRLPKNLPPTTSRAITKGDTKVYAIAAASIIAKVTRDRMMLELHQQYPQYSFDVHKGYGTSKHTALIKEHGPCPAHRRTFNPVKTWFYPPEEDEKTDKKKAAKGKTQKKNWM